jgi:hypothetical protein
MSTKTILKRLSLVAVTALGAGVLAIVPVSTASADATVLAVQTNVQNTAPCSDGTPSSSSTPRYMPVGGKQALSFTGTPLTTETISITGPAKFTTAGTGYSISGSDAKEVTLAAAAVTSGAGPVVEFTGVGSVVIKLDSGSNSTDSYLYFIVQASCASAWSATYSRAQLNTTAGASATSSIDSSAASSRDYSGSGQYGYLDIILKDAYDVALSTTNTAKIATATGGCTVNWDTAASTGTTTAVDPAAASDATEDLVIIGDNTPRTCTVTVTFGDTVVASKTIKMLGEVASLTIDPANSGTIWGYGVDGTSASGTGTAANENKIVYVAKDSAGNVINLASEPALAGATNGASQCTIGTGDYAATAIITNGYATKDVNCTNASVRGPAVYKLAITRTSDAVTVFSNEIKVEVNKAKNTFKASWDKAVYNIGDIMTLTIEGFDDKGFKNYDGDTAGSAVAINVSGATRLSATPATGDKFSKGVLKYQYSAGTTAAQYGWNALVSTVSGQDMVVGTYTIKDPNTGTTNADVLKSIVALIASINKQIQALQKLILRR